MKKVSILAAIIGVAAISGFAQVSGKGMQGGGRMQQMTMCDSTMQWTNHADHLEMVQKMAIITKQISNILELSGGEMKAEQADNLSKTTDELSQIMNEMLTQMTPGKMDAPRTKALQNRLNKVQIKAGLLEKEAVKGKK